jgi:hypothetical protein
MPTPRRPSFSIEPTLDWVGEKLFPGVRTSEALVGGKNILMMTGDRRFTNAAETGRHAAVKEEAPFSRAPMTIEDPEGGPRPLFTDPALQSRIRAGLDDADQMVFKLYNVHARRPNWIADTVEANQVLQSTVGKMIEGLRHQAESVEPPAELFQIQEGTHDLHRLLMELSLRSHREVGGPAGLPKPPAERFLFSYYRVPNGLINCLENTGSIASAAHWMRTSRELLENFHAPEAE